MATRYKSGSHYENHQRATELQDLGAHSHSVGEQKGESEHLSGPEQSRNAQEHVQEEFEAHNGGATVGHGIAAFGHRETEELAYKLWVEGGSPEGSAEEDWFEALRILKSRSFAH